jgi:hypothetical protein
MTVIVTGNKVDGKRRQNVRNKPGGSSPPTLPTTQDATVQFNFPEATPTYYGRLFAAQADQHEIVLSFFDPRLPVLTGSSQEVLQQAQGITSVRADCVARVVILPERVSELISVLQTALTTHRQLAPKK